MLGERSKRCITMNQKQIFPFLANRLALLLGRMLAVVLLCSTVSCYHQSQQSPDAWNLTDDQIDSISFYTTHHYAQNFNFVVVGDSLELMTQAPDEVPYDSLMVYRGDRLVVAEIMTIPSDTIDSVWVKVARDQLSQGWVREQQLLSEVAPDDPISQFISFFSDTHLLIFLAFMAVVLAVYSLFRLNRRHAYIVHFHDIPSIYPTMLALLVSASAMVYSSIQLFAPESWRHFYYNPTLNPFALPPHLSLFMSMVWALVVVSLAVVDDTLRRLPWSGALLYLCGLAAVCAVDYVVFSVSTLYYIGYILLPVYVVFALRCLRLSFGHRCICGRCGAELSEKGICPQCGAMNI